MWKGYDPAGGIYSGGNTRPGVPPMTREQTEALKRRQNPTCTICGMAESRYPYLLQNFQLDDMALPMCGGCKNDFKELACKLVTGKRATLGLPPLNFTKQGASR